MKKGQTRKNKKNREVLKQTSTESSEVKRGIWIAVIVLVVFAVVYLIAAIMTGEIQLWHHKEADEVEIQYQEILGGETFSKSDEDYYVLYMSYSNPYASYYLTLTDLYTEKSDSMPVYLVDLDKGFNRSIQPADGEATNPNAQSVSELKVSHPTLVHIQGGRNVSYLEGKDTVESYLETLAQEEEESEE